MPILAMVSSVMLFSEPNYSTVEVFGVALLPANPRDNVD